MKNLLICGIILIMLCLGCATMNEGNLIDNMKQAKYAMGYYYANNNEIYPSNQSEMLEVIHFIPQEVDNCYNEFEKAIIFGNELPKWNKKDIGKVYVRYSITGYTYSIYGFGSKNILNTVLFPTTY